MIQKLEALNGRKFKGDLIVLKTKKPGLCII